MIRQGLGISLMALGAVSMGVALRLQPEDREVLSLVLAPAALPLAVAGMTWINVGGALYEWGGGW